MGMFDKPQYLTGDEGYVGPGETFWLHAARLDGTVNVNGKERDQVKLLVSKPGQTDEAVTVFSSGAGIVNQVRRMDRNDMNAMPMEVRLDQIESGKGNATNVLTPASQPPAAQGAATATEF